MRALKAVRPKSSRHTEEALLTLRPIRDEDRPHVRRILGDVNLTKLLFAGRPLTAAEADEFINKHFKSADERDGLGVLCLGEAEEVIGFAGLLPCSALDEEDFEFGFVVDQEHQGQRYATVIGKLQIKYGFEELSLERILALVHCDNEGSRKILREKLRMTYVTTKEIDGREPREVYSLERSEYLNNKDFYG